MNVSLGLAFLAGLASFLSPCVLPLVPAYIGYLGGRSMGAKEGGAKPGSTRWITIGHGIAFILGFSLVFILLGIAMSAIGGLLFSMRSWLAKIGGVVVIVFGLHMTGIFRISFLEYDLRPQNTGEIGGSIFSSLLMGVFFSAGWSPCVGPTLGAILTLAINGGSISESIPLLSAYSAGMAVPFLLAAVGIGWVAVLLARFKKIMRYTEIVMGVVMVVVGVMLFLGTFQYIANYGFFVDFGI
jgi:cytochrome c-type biogenesis protein